MLVAMTYSTRVRMTTSNHTRLLNFEGAINTVVFIHWNGLLDWNIVKFISYAIMIMTLHYWS